MYALYVLAAYLLFCKLWPFVLYPNYLFKSEIEQYPELKELAERLKREDKFETIKNVYAYMQDTYSGHREVLRMGSLLSVFKLGDFSTNNIINEKQFLWCHTQNRVMKSILVNTGQFNENDIVIKRVYLKSCFIHQWFSIEDDGKVITIDPYYGLFQIDK